MSQVTMHQCEQCKKTSADWYNEPGWIHFDPGAITLALGRTPEPTPKARNQYIRFPSEGSDFCSWACLHKALMATTPPGAEIKIRGAAQALRYIITGAAPEILDSHVWLVTPRDPVNVELPTPDGLKLGHRIIIKDQVGFAGGSPIRVSAPGGIILKPPDAVAGDYLIDTDYGTAAFVVGKWNNQPRWFHDRERV